MSDIRIKMIKTARSMSLLNGACSIVAKKGHVYNANSNLYGAISVKIEGKVLGIKPDEFEFIEAPSWVLDKHDLLHSKFDQLKHQNKRLMDALIKVNSVLVFCHFCSGKYGNHYSYCEYIELTKKEGAEK